MRKKEEERAEERERWNGENVRRMKDVLYRNEEGREDEGEVLGVDRRARN